MRCFAAIVSALALACASATEPSRPLPAAPIPKAPEEPAKPPVVNPAPTFTVTGSAAWTLELNHFSVLLFRRAGSSVFQYVPEHLELSETGGKSSATLLSMDVAVAGGIWDGDCTSEQTVRGQTINPGGTRDFVATMGYCIPYATSHAEISQVTLTATFADNQGKVGQVQSVVSVAGCTLGGKEGPVSCK